MSVAELPEFWREKVGRLGRGCRYQPASSEVTMPSILVVDDEVDQRAICRAYLEHFGYEVWEARNGVEAILAVCERSPDLVLMDIGMPVMSGWDATRALKADPNTAGIPVIAFTAVALESDEERARRIGFDGFLARPCYPKAIAEVVERFVPPASVPPHPWRSRCRGMSSDT